MPEVYLNAALAKSVGRKKRHVAELLAEISYVSENIEFYSELIGSSENMFTEEELSDNLAILDKRVEQLYVKTLYNGTFDNADCFLEIHSGAGGEEAQDWAEMLCRMYMRYAQLQGYDAKVVDSLAGTGAGYKSVTLLIGGEGAYGNLINEKGVHRLVRISPFDANKRRHTSFASVDVSPMIEEAPVEIKAEDLKIDTFCSGGAGGQHVNKTESAVRITHIPTGIVVQCQNERSQLQNKEFALKMLASKLSQMQQEEQEKQKALEKSLDKKIEWGSQIRSYVLHPYNMVKDHRTNFQTSNTAAVLDGEIQEFIVANLIEKSKSN